MDDKLVGPVSKLLGPLDKEMDLQMDVELAKSTKHHRHGKIWYAEANLVMPYVKAPVRARALELTIFAAIDEVKNELEREIKKYKDKTRTKTIRTARKLKRRA